MANSYIPRADARAVLWMEAFARGISANSSLYMLTPGQAQSIQEAVDNFVAACLVAKNESTRTKCTCIAKDNARSIAETMCREYATLIKNNLGVSDDDKVAIGVRPQNRARHRNHCPQSSPLISVLACTAGRQVLRYRDTFTPTSPGKPFGAAFLEMRVAVADAPISDVAHARPAGLFTRNPITVEFTEADDRKKATYFGRWVSRRGDTGPWSSPVSMSIAA